MIVHIVLLSLPENAKSTCDIPLLIDVYRYKYLATSEMEQLQRYESCSTGFLGAYNQGSEVLANCSSEGSGIRFAGEQA